MAFAKTRSRMVLMLSASAVAFAAASAQAQTAATDSKDVEEVVVTGTRVIRDGYDAPTPTTVVGADMLEKRAPLTLVDAVATLPGFKQSATPGTASQSAAGGNGQSFVNLRGLGPNRTLVLLDGQRFIPSTSLATVDVSVLPSFLIKRVDVVTGGASASWGSDAVAGVVNFVLDHDLNGFKGNAQAGISSRGDGANQTLSLAYGTKVLDDRGHVLVGAEYYHNEGVLAGKRPWSRNIGDTMLSANPAFTPTNGQARLLLNPFNYFTGTYSGVVITAPARGTTFNPDGSIRSGLFTYCRATTSAATFIENCDGPQEDRPWVTKFTVMAAQVDRGTAYARGDYDLTNNLTVHADALYGTSKTEFLSGLTTSISLGNATLATTNPFVPTALRNQLTAAGLTSFQMAKSFDDFTSDGTSHVTRRNTTQRYVIGLDGKLAKDWKISSYAEYGQNRSDYVFPADPIGTRFREALDAVVSPTGTIVCRSTLTSPNNGCVPLNPFKHVIGGRPPAEVAYFLGNAQSKLNLKEYAAAINLTGEPFNLPAGPVSVAMGAEYRKETAVQVADANSLALRYVGANQQPIDGSLNVKEAYAEVVAPIAKDMPFIKNLDVSAAGRITDYSTSGEVETWKVGLNYSPIEDLRLRLTRSRDIRAPNILEIFNSPLQSTAIVIDPRNNVTTVLQSFTSGNPNLKPEIADTFSYGAVYRPSWFGGFSASVDVYQIKIDGAIGSLTNQQLVDRCQAGNTELCVKIIRNAAGQITQINNTTLNLSKFRVSGIDFDASYNFDLADVGAGLPGAVGLRAIANYTYEFETNDGVTRIDQAGAILSGQPDWSADFTATYSNGPLGLMLNWVYLGGGRYDAQYREGIDINDNTVKATSYINAQVSWTQKIAAGQIVYYANANNIFDEDPPREFLANGNNYDRIGRRVVAGVRFRY